MLEFIQWLLLTAFLTTFLASLVLFFIFAVILVTRENSNNSSEI